MGNLLNRIRFNEQIAAEKKPAKKRPMKSEMGKLKESIEKIPRTEPLPAVTRDAGEKHAKKPVNIRLDVEVIDAFKSQGSGWQTKVNAALRKHLGLR
jgi:uncharacterized protein (DUF4415 family)